MLTSDKTSIFLRSVKPFKVILLKINEYTVFLHLFDISKNSILRNLILFLHMNNIFL